MKFFIYLGFLPILMIIFKTINIEQSVNLEKTPGYGGKPFF